MQRRVGNAMTGIQRLTTRLQLETKVIRQRWTHAVFKDLISMGAMALGRKRLMMIVLARD
jgi:hypothetical protein